MPTYIHSSERAGYTDLSFADAQRALLEGQPVIIWWFDQAGDRHTERVLFTEFNFLSEELDEPTASAT